MPATAGRVRMPHDNRMMTSSSLQTSSVWKNVIKYDPYAASDAAGAPTAAADAASAKLIEQSNGLMELAKLQAARNEPRTTCRRCGGSGHLTHECRNARVAGAATSARYEEISESAVVVLPPSLSGAVSVAAPVSAQEGGGERDRGRDRSRDREERGVGKSHRRRRSHSSGSSGSSKSRHKRHGEHKHHHRHHRHRHHRSRSRSREDRRRDRKEDEGKDRGRDRSPDRGHGRHLEKERLNGGEARERDKDRPEHRNRESGRDKERDRG